MKEFLKSVLATITGLIVFGVIIGVLSVMSIVGMVASGQATKSVKDNSVLVINLSGNIQEQATDNVLGQFTDNNVNNIGLDETLSAIKKAAKSDKIKGIYIEAGLLDGKYATLEEIRNALLKFQKTNKWIVAYGDTYSQGAYYVASVADHIYMNPQGILDWHGIASQPMYIKDLAAKFGVKYQVVKVGAYKSATEMFTEEKMSDANRHQVTAYVGGLWKNICNDVSKSRKISVDSLNAYADRLMTLADAKDVKAAKMVDDLIYADQVKAYVKKLMKIEKDDAVPQITVTDMASTVTKDDGEDEIAVYYAQGTIVQNATTMSFSDESQIVAQTVCKDLEELMNDDDVKAVVIRLNSGGGDAYASEQIWHQVELLKKKKPVVISMGDYAASGAYYMSCPASWIVAQPNTLTGSIGIFGVIPDFSGLITQKLGVKFDEVKTNKFSDFGDVMSRPLNADELKYLSAHINRGYQLFRKRVADGRKMTVPAVENIAQGHVWLATDAMKIKLVDQLGGLSDAVAKAASLAKTKSYYTENYPAPMSMIDKLLNGSSRSSYLDDQLRLTLGDVYEPFMLLKNLNRRSAIQAQLPIMLNIK